jgi:hypothetical protein
MTDYHTHYEYASDRHDHRGEYADPGHKHEAYDLYGVATQGNVSELRALIGGLREDLSRAEERICELETRLHDHEQAVPHPAVTA